MPMFDQKCWQQEGRRLLTSTDDGEKDSLFTKCLRCDENSKFSDFSENKRINITLWFTINVCKARKSCSFSIKKIR